METVSSDSNTRRLSSHCLFLSRFIWFRAVSRRAPLVVYHLKPILVFAYPDQTKPDQIRSDRSRKESREQREEERRRQERTDLKLLLLLARLRTIYGLWELLPTLYDYFTSLPLNQWKPRSNHSRIEIYEDDKIIGTKPKIHVNVTILTLLLS